jgi:2-dehydropantoate 2-reductase
VRYVVIGAGAIGGAIAGRLVEADRDVVLVARGANYLAIAQKGLTLAAPDRTVVVDIEVVDGVEGVAYQDDDVIINAVKGQDTLAVLSQVAPLAPPSVRIVCAQNGVENERVALRLFSRVYAMCVMCPSTYLTPGEIQLFTSPTSGVLDVGRYPGSVDADADADAIAEDLTAATFHSSARADIAILKWGKLMNNLHNAIEALCGHDVQTPELARRVRDEAVAVLQSHDVDADAAQRALRERISLVAYAPVGGAGRGGGSSWQSLQRGTGSIEVDYLNGEIVLLGRLAGIATPANAVLQRRAIEVAVAREGPGGLTEEELLAEIDALTADF